MKKNYARKDYIIMSYIPRKKLLEKEGDLANERKLNKEIESSILAVQCQSLAKNCVLSTLELSKCFHCVTSTVERMKPFPVSRREALDLTKSTTKYCVI